MNLTSIYGYLNDRFGVASYKTGASFFLLSRTIGASFRLYLVAIVLQLFIFDAWNIPFWLTVAVTILLIWLYTFKGGIKTIVWTDSLQTLFMLLALGLSIYFIGSELNMGMAGLVSTVADSAYSQIFFFENGWSDSKNFFKQFLSGASIALVMTGLDQDMMQKNLSCRTLGDAQKNMFWFSIVLVIVNFIFLCLGVLLYHYMATKGLDLPLQSDYLFPTVAIEHLSPFVGGVFIIGLLAAAYSSADSALTSLTTSFCVDFLDFEKGKENKQTRYAVHIGFSVLLLFVILVFNAINDQAVIAALFKVAGYTYGPLLGLYSFGILTKRSINDNLAPIVCILSPIICYLLNTYSTTLLWGYKFGFELLILNGLLTFIGLWLISKKD